MEGQQPDPGDLNDEVPQPSVEESETTEVSELAETPESPEASEPSEAAETGAVAKVPREPSALRKWFARNRIPVTVLSSVGLFVGAGAFAGAMVQPYLADRAAVSTKLRIAQTAANAITTLWSYTPENMDKLSDRASKYLGGDFEEQYRKYVDAIATTNKQAKITSNTQVVGAAVESLHGSPQPNEATAIVYTNTTSTTPEGGNLPSMKYLAYRLELKREGRDWHVTKMTTVTSLDLTPRLGP